MLSCTLSIEGTTGEEDSRWLRRHAANEDVYRFACGVIAGKTTNLSNWPYFCLGLFCASTCCNHWYEHCFGHVQFRCHWVAQLLRPWLTLRNCVLLPMWLHAEPDLQGECASKPPPEAVSRMRIGMRIGANAHQSVDVRMRITGTVWTGL